MEHGTITSVRYEKGVVLCNVRPSRVQGAGDYPDVPMLKPFSAFSVVPSIGQKVAMAQLSDGSRFITDVVTREPDGSLPADLQPGDLAIQLDADTKVTFTQNSAGNYDVHIDASGDIYLGDENSAKPIARQGDAVETELSVGTITEGSANVNSD